ncbi:uncharacterized protein J8A68_004325 [[Candida] subhashii]|uniref:N-acetyltransferase domain-containing protein n=1 Tax=[Candida] subhashii TaxID=561895 RepID=A0A8J5QK49_9ASCO|nr:uncharacterized protein J8A68_004325 [[Candida] subhashii]KAG7662197.1 hypothetical protein J8A68_004325 [[Candida] subhashii]
MADFPPNLSIRPLTIEDIDQCIQLENKGFNEDERCTPEKFQYRLNVCPELCSGLFIREYEYKYNAINLPEIADKLEQQHRNQQIERQLTNKDGKDEGNAATAEDDDDDDLPSKSSVVNETLIGHIIATKVASNTITEESMELPSSDKPGSGHVESSRHIGIHSIVIEPEWRGKNLGALLLHDYIQKLSNQDLGDQVILLARKDLITFYEKIGFNNLGESKCKHGGSIWYDMAIDLVATDDL